MNGYRNGLKQGYWEEPWDGICNCMGYYVNSQRSGYWVVMDKRFNIIVEKIFYEYGIWVSRVKRKFDGENNIFFTTYYADFKWIHREDLE